MACRGGRLNEQQCAIEVAFPLLTALAGLHEIGVFLMLKLMLAPFGHKRCSRGFQTHSLADHTLSNVHAAG
eukprot:scaffold94065_cov21-Tisochrysis_lutea.AAC.2